jgi:hypothetical protein
MQTQQIIRVVFALALATAGCGGAGKSGAGGGGDTGGEGGDDMTTGGSGGAAGASGGSGGSATKKDASAEGGASGGSGGSSGSGGTAPEADAAAGAGGASDASAGGTSGDSDAAGGAGGGENGSPEALGWYEAEAVPPNTLFGATKAVMCGTAPACASHEAVKEGVECCSAGKKLSQLLRGTGGAVMNGLSAPADGMYDVTWWFHCGKDDNFGDTNCGGAPHTKSGCRPHILVVNGVKLPKVYHFPCFPGSWGQIHASTTTIPLKAGAMNSIRIYATPGRDAADLDALQIFPAGKGVPPTIAGTAN